MWRYACPHTDVRGGCRDLVAGQEAFGFEGLGASDCEAVRDWQGARRAGTEALRDSSQHLAFGRAVPLVSAAGGHLTSSCRDTFARLRQRGCELPVSVSRWPPTELAPCEGYFGQPAGSGLMSTIVWLVDIISFDGGTRGIELIS